LLEAASCFLVSVTPIHRYSIFALKPKKGQLAEIPPPIGSRVLHQTLTDPILPTASMSIRENLQPHGNMCISRESARCCFVLSRYPSCLHGPRSWTAQAARCCLFSRRGGTSYRSRYGGGISRGHTGRHAHHHADPPALNLLSKNRPGPAAAPPRGLGAQADEPPARDLRRRRCGLKRRLSRSSRPCKPRT
jgi:hypothetical protein